MRSYDPPPRATPAIWLVRDAVFFFFLLPSRFSPQRRPCSVSCPVVCSASFSGRCATVTCGCRCGRGPPAARLPACREPRAARWCCSSSCWPTRCGTASWWTGDPGRAGRAFCVAMTCAADVFLHCTTALRCSARAASRFSSLSGETVAAGVVTCLVVYPLYLFVFTLFRMSRSKVTRACSALRPPPAF